MDDHTITPPPTEPPAWDFEEPTGAPTPLATKQDLADLMQQLRPSIDHSRLSGDDDLEVAAIVEAMMADPVKGMKQQTGYIVKQLSTQVGKIMNDNMAAMRQEQQADTLRTRMTDHIGQNLNEGAKSYLRDVFNTCDYKGLQDMANNRTVINTLRNAAENVHRRMGSTTTQTVTPVGSAGVTGTTGTPPNISQEDEAAAQEFLVRMSNVKFGKKGHERTITIEDARAMMKKARQDDAGYMQDMALGGLSDPLDTGR